MAQTPLVTSTVAGPGVGATVVLGGELDFGNVAELRAVLADIIKRSSGQVSIDLGKVSFLDSTALGVLLQAKKRLVQRGDDLVVTDVQPGVRRTLDMTGVTDYLGA